MAKYIPEKGDFITLSFDPQSDTNKKADDPRLLSAILFSTKPQV